ncbi:MAG: HAMP domain-containing sensor histidine kinase [Planctomycetota bacterium]|nr:HAMP domain-containing sensor histidine kinase [Planctomycetota bacterium]MDG2143814.1 HAMP domain-containing sensor histidine kinase [Planctomycetota bacterium]
MQRISTKLVLAVLAAVALPFLAFTVYLDQAVNQGFTRRVTEQALQSVAADLGGRLDQLVTSSSDGLDLLAQHTFVSYVVEDSAAMLAGDATADPLLWLDEVVESFDRRVATGGLYDLILLVDANGRLIASNSMDRNRQALGPRILADLAARDYKREDWFTDTMLGAPVRMDQHASNLLQLQDTIAERRAANELQPTDYHLGFGLPLTALGKSNLDPGPGPHAVLFALVNWEPFQELVEAPVVKETFRGLVREGQEPSPYGWIWDSKADTIFAHKNTSLYGTRITADLNLGILTDAVVNSKTGWDLYPPYEFLGVEKTAAFKRCGGEEMMGFSWVVGVGIDDADMFASNQATRRLLKLGSAAVLLVILLWTMVIARRMTSPIHALQELTERVASGDLEARLEPQSRDELGALTEAFNRMTSDLAAKQEQLIRVEKDAAWREMARQIAHDIKNSLTPIKITLGLLQRAHTERSEQFETILDDTLEMMQRKVVDLDEISKDFAEFTGGRKANPTQFSGIELVQEVFGLYGAMADEAGIELRVEGDSCDLYLDRHKLSRVLENTVTNAFQAMPEGGVLVAHLTSSDSTLVIELLDTGVGVSDEAREHLFEPYFTTRSEGTGLGLAITYRVLEDMGGSIELEARKDGKPGTVARIALPRQEPPS